MTTKVYLVELEEKAAATLASKRRPTGARRRRAEFSGAWELGKSVAGYGPTSPIWNKTRTEVKNTIADLQKEVITALRAGDKHTADKLEEKITLLEHELEVRKAARAVAFGALKK